jgi:hypothetical protein
MRKRTGVKAAPLRKFSQYLKTLLDAYQGLIYYVDWKEALFKRTEPSQNTSLSQSFYGEYLIISVWLFVVQRLLADMYT